MAIWVSAIIVAYAVALVFGSLKLIVWLLNAAYDQGVKKGKELELEEVLKRITRETWTFRKERDGMFAYCKLVSEAGEIPVPGPVAFEDGEQILIQKRLPHHTRCPFFFLGYEAHLSVSVYHPYHEEEEDDS